MVPSGFEDNHTIAQECETSAFLSAKVQGKDAQEADDALFWRWRQNGLRDAEVFHCVTVDGKKYTLGFQEALYVGRGAKNIEVNSKDAAKPYPLAEFCGFRSWNQHAWLHTKGPAGKVGFAQNILHR